MNCKSCNTRIPRGVRKCPNCGLVSGVGMHSTQTEDDRPAGRILLGPSNAQEEIDLDEIATPDPGRTSSRKTRPRPRPRSRASSRPSSRPSPKPKRERSTSSESKSAGWGSAPDPAEVRALVTANPTLIEPGLSIYKQGDKQVGSEFETDVGTIDLLVTDGSGGLIVILLATASSKDIVSDMLGQIGWVQKHLCKSGQEVRGIVLAESMPEGAEYAAAAVADTVSFKSYQVTLRFTDLET